MAKGKLFVFLLILIVIVLAGCSGSQMGGEQAASGDGSISKSGSTGKASNNPVTVKVAMNVGGYLTDEEFDRFVVNPVQKRYPNITVQRVRMDPKTNSYENMVAVGDIPDIMIHATPVMSQLKPLGVEYDISSLIKKQNLDMSRFDPNLMNAVKITSEHDYLIGLPYTTHFSALYYNKDIFDKFGVAYPKDGMTWDDAIELAKKLTRNVDGVQYRGLEPDSIARPSSALSLPFIDPKTDKAVLETEQWKKVFDMMRRIYTIPGNDAFEGVNKFAKDKKIAMLASLNYIAEIAKVPDLNWDLASYPVFPEMPHNGAQVDEHLMLITSTSKHKDAAFQVLSTVTSDEVQLDMARNGRVSVLTDAKFKQDFGKDLPYLKGKHIQSAFLTSPAKPYVPTAYINIAKSEAQKALTSVVKNGVDINTALRNADEQIDKQIEDAKGK